MPTHYVAVDTRIIVELESVFNEERHIEVVNDIDQEIERHLEAAATEIADMLREEYGLTEDQYHITIQ